jgi:hypothetical protein
VSSAKFNVLIFNEVGQGIPLDKMGGSAYVFLRF